MRRLIAGGVVAITLVLMLVLPALGAELTGPCSIDVRSFNGPDPATSTKVDDAPVSGEVVEGAVGSRSRPFKVDPEGSIDFAFHTETVFANNRWAIYAQGLPIPVLAGMDDKPLDRNKTGVVSLNAAVKALPFRIVGTFFVSADLEDNAGTTHCHGEGYVQVVGDPVGTVLWDIAAALIVLSGLVLLVATPYSSSWETDPKSGERTVIQRKKRHPLMGLFFGLVLGLGLGLMAIVYGWYLAGSFTPWLVVVLGVVIGLLMSFVPRPWGRNAPPAGYRAR